MTSIASRRLPEGKPPSFPSGKRFLVGPGELGTTNSRMAEGDREALKT